MTSFEETQVFQIDDQTIVHPDVRNVFGKHIIDMRYRGSHSRGFTEWGGSPKPRFANGIFLPGLNDTTEIGGFSGYYNPVAGNMIRRPSFGETLFRIYAAEIYDEEELRFLPGPRSTDMLFQLGGFDLRATIDPFFRKPATSAAFTAPKPAGDYVETGWAMGFQGPLQSDKDFNRRVMLKRFRDLQPDDSVLIVRL